MESRSIYPQKKQKQKQKTKQTNKKKKKTRAWSPLISCAEIVRALFSVSSGMPHRNFGVASLLVYCSAEMI